MTGDSSYLRKIQKTGGSSYIVALPIEWIRKTKLKKGDAIRIFPQPDGNLLIQPLETNYRHVGGEVEINTADILDTNLILRLILSKYLAGYQVIKVHDQYGINFELRTEIEQFVQNLMGVEILEESNNWIILKDLSSLESLDLNQLIRRIHVLADKMFTTAVKAFVNRNKDSAHFIKLQETSVDRLYYLISRQLNAILSDLSYSSYLGIKLVEVLDYRVIVKRLESIADHAYDIAGHILEMDETIEDDYLLKEIEKLGEQVKKRYNSAMNCFYNNKVKEANELANEKAEFEEELKALYGNINKLESEIAVRFILVIRSFSRISSYAADIAEVVINRERGVT
ncbi:MAG: PhoU domain-containing protein [Candidatus Heimdallarchaeaceae archaeon]